MLDLNSILTSLKQMNGEFTSNLKSILKPYLYAGKDLQLQENSIAFKATSTNKNAAIVPLFIEVNHK
jgi:hypothetical protein